MHREADWPDVEADALFVVALAIILLLELEFHISEFITGLLGLGFILAAYTSSVLANRKDTKELVADGLADDGQGVDEHAKV